MIESAHFLGYSDTFSESQVKLWFLKNVHSVASREGLTDRSGFSDDLLEYQKKIAKVLFVFLSLILEFPLLHVIRNARHMLVQWS